MGTENTPDVEVSRRDAATAVAVLIKQARVEIQHGNISAADEALAVAERLAITADAKDAGQIVGARDL